MITKEKTKVNPLVVSILGGLSIILIAICLFLSFSFFDKTENDFINNSFSSSPEAQSNIKLFYSLPSKVKDVFNKNKIRIIFTNEQPLNADNKAPSENYFYNSKTKILEVQIFPKLINTDDNGKPFGGYNYVFSDNFNEFNFLIAVASIYDNGYLGSKNFETVFTQAGDNFIKYGYLINLSPTSKTMLSTLNIEPLRYFKYSFALYFISKNTNEILKEKAPGTYEYIKSITIK